MNKAETTAQREETPVDDVRRVRERLDREAGGNVYRRAEQSRRVAEKYVRLLRLRRVSLDDVPRARHRARTAGHSEETPVDDVRRVRERLSREAGGDVRRLMEQSQRFLDEHWKSLGLKRVSSKGTPRPLRKHRVVVVGKQRKGRV